MLLRVNGIEQSIEGCKSLAEFLDAKKLNYDHIVVEFNNDIVPKERWREIALSEMDNIEIVSFVGGG